MVKYSQNPQSQILSPLPSSGSGISSMFAQLLELSGSDTVMQLISIIYLFGGKLSLSLMLLRLKSISESQTLALGKSEMLILMEGTMSIPEISFRIDSIK